MLHFHETVRFVNNYCNCSFTMTRYISNLIEATETKNLSNTYLSRSCLSILCLCTFTFFFTLQSYDFEWTVMKVITETRRAH